MEERLSRNMATLNAKIVGIDDPCDLVEAVEVKLTQSLTDLQFQIASRCIPSEKVEERLINRIVELSNKLEDLNDQVADATAASDYPRENR